VALALCGSHGKPWEPHLLSFLPDRLSSLLSINLTNWRKMKEPKAIEPAPFIRWAGGKRTLAPMLLSAIPATFDENNSRFFEPFVGGGAVMFALSQKFQNPKLIINDVNPDLVATCLILKGTLERRFWTIRVNPTGMSVDVSLKK